MEFQASYLPSCPIGSVNVEVVEESLQARAPL
jgi:hypothetical protein